MNIRAAYRPRSGWRDHEMAERTVTILGFTEATIEPGYQSHGSKRCIVAVVADEDGRLSTAELADLKIDPAS